MVKRMVVYVSSNVGMFRYRFHRPCMYTPVFYPKRNRIPWLNTKSCANGFWNGALSFTADGHYSYLKRINIH